MRPVILAVLVLSGAAPAYAQDVKTEEAAIRALIERENENGTPVPVVRGSVFWSGAYKGPVMDDERAVEIDRDRAPSKRVPGTTRSTRHVRKLEVAASGDMAWEFSTGETSFQLKSGGSMALPTSTLRVWRKDHGVWKVVAMFNHPHAE